MNYLYHRHSKRLSFRSIKVVRSVIVNIFNKYGIFKVFNHQKDERPRICFIFEILTHQLRRSRKISTARTAARIFDMRARRCAAILSIRGCRPWFLRCACGATALFAAYLLTSVNKDIMRKLHGNIYYYITVIKMIPSLAILASVTNVLPIAIT